MPLLANNTPVSHRTNTHFHLLSELPLPGREPHSPGLTAETSYLSRINVDLNQMSNSKAERMFLNIYNVQAY
jgi:hypothetical protein